MFWYALLINNNVVEHYRKRIKILHGCPFEGWPNQQGTAIPPFLADGLGWLCPVKSALKRTLMQDLNSFSIMIYYIISTPYQKIGDLFCPVHISWLSHSVDTSYLTDSYIAFTLKLESGQKFCSNRSSRSSKYCKKTFWIFIHLGRWLFLVLNLWFSVKLLLCMK